MSTPPQTPSPGVSPFTVASLPGDARDDQLIEAALAGSDTALNQLLARHQDWLYNVALKMCLSPADAEDLTQEALIKIVTKLGQFAGRSSFRTWAYRIALNHYLNAKARPMEAAVTSFEAYDADLERIPDQDPSTLDALARDEWIAEAKVSCLSGMLLCLDRGQRLTYIVGELFGADHRAGAALFDITPASFRKRLQRARTDLRAFMQHRCGLVDPANPCRCARKTAGFIDAGWVDPSSMRFRASYTRTIAETLPARTQQLDDLLEEVPHALQRDTPFQEKSIAARTLRALLADRRVRQLFSLDSPLS